MTSIRALGPLAYCGLLLYTFCEEMKQFIKPFRVFLGILVFLYIPACFIEAVGEPGPSSVTGFTCLLYGWRVFPPAWVANVFLFAGIIFIWYKEYKVAAWLGLTGALLGLSMWFFVDSLGTGLLVGYYFWQISLFAFFFLAYLLQKEWDIAVVEPRGDQADENNELDPKYKGAYLNRGMARYNKGDQDEAIADFNKVIELDPKDKDVYYNRGMARYNKGDQDEAIADFNKVIELDPEDKDAYLYRGLTRYEKGDPKGAIADFNKVIELDPKFVGAYFNRGLVLLNQGKDTQAQRDFNRGLKLDPNLKSELEKAIKAVKSLRAKKP